LEKYFLKRNLRFEIYFPEMNSEKYFSEYKFYVLKTTF